ncbi:uncharacterized protein LOC17876969 [Capsella rubella]|uniref:uncharacterized protein LOC17876969 n=1 Tax=Capsella rubella TaxID=81985 RepID=UPI000CD5A4AC|nr:uncharacterized protein LOC17876969 [Capsella rubella]
MTKKRRKLRRPPLSIAFSSKFKRMLASTLTSTSISSAGCSISAASHPFAAAAQSNNSILVETQGILPSTPLMSLELILVRSGHVPQSLASVETSGSPSSSLEQVVGLPPSGSFVSEISSAGPNGIPQGIAVPKSVVGIHSLGPSVSEISSAEPIGTTQGIATQAPTPQTASSPKNTSVGTIGKDTTAPSTRESLWATKFKASLHNLRQMDAPSFREDGTPVVMAPPSVLLKTAEMWKGHLVAQLHGLFPPPTKIFNDLNPIWGKFGNIIVRIISETTALIFIPSTTTRQWVVDIGFWQAGNCAYTVYPWSPEGPMELEELHSAPTWAILKRVPPQLYSLEGISVIASGIGKPLHTEKSRLDPINIGSTKVKVLINLHFSLPTTVVVKDVQGNTARVEVEYPRPPPKCLNCGRYGHLLSRCPLPLQKNFLPRKTYHLVQG